MPIIDYSVCCEYCGAIVVEGTSTQIPPFSELITECEWCSEELCRNCGNFSGKIHSKCSILRDNGSDD